MIACYPYLAQTMWILQQTLIVSTSKSWSWPFKVNWKGQEQRVWANDRQLLSHPVLQDTHMQGNACCMYSLELQVSLIKVSILQVQLHMLFYILPPSLFVSWPVCPWSHLPRKFDEASTVPSLPCPSSITLPIKQNHYVNTTTCPTQQSTTLLSVLYILW